MSRTRSPALPPLYDGWRRTLLGERANRSLTVAQLDGLASPEHQAVAWGR